MPISIFVRPGKEHAVRSRHPWIFSGALLLPQDGQKKILNNGDIVDVISSEGKKFIARGYFNGNSQIAVRILTRDFNEEINLAFFERRFHQLAAVRETYINTRETNAYRVVFGESDEIPGLIVDKYNDIYVIQIHTLGMDRLRDLVIKALRNVFNPRSIYERSDVGVRAQEGLADMPKGLLYGESVADEIEIIENGVRFLVNVKEGQKTGLFLDQRENRRALQRYVSGKRVLNCFSYTGGFSLYSALAGATETVSVDLSGQALATGRRMFELNGLSSNKHQFIEKDAFAYLDECFSKRDKFDVIILDPPAFVKNQKSLKKGLSGYLFINEKALRMLPTGGILVTSSCSAHVTEEMFQKMIALAAGRANCGVKVLEIRHQPLDHPFNPNFPEGKYLKFYVVLKG